MDQKRLNETALEIRRSIIRSVYAAGSGHPGGSLSAVEIMTALYFEKMKIDPKNPKWEERDRFILSKGHAAPVLYAALAEKGFFPKEELLKLRHVDAMLQGHPDMKGTPGVEMSTGSLGQGFSTSIGMALGAKLDQRSNRIYVLLGDGEVQEGIVWEAAMAAAHYQLDNLTAFMDYNGLQIDGNTDEVMNINPITDKWKSFGWNVVAIDGHDYDQIFDALEKAESTKNQPTVIIAKTVKGKGVSFMENQAGWHGNAPKKEEAEKALEELGGVL
ncbi:transketolase [Geosporobacter ferrireducens]|uniref:Transketolase n=1 Tax=Geosporobacter ferrireducens TaxID=1424294 RepID=A0A1D8GQU0_9FIRM|nr:transketolase [Geosporobacter ferrireducens]AOT73233.1 transketolase [Geosporobacter ferrireducens]MTI55490.1 transketolase [Geosporobacter ferrireducens]